MTGHGCGFMGVVFSWTGFAVALGIGLLIGAERERRKGGDGRAVAGIRTFAVVALLGAASASFGVAMLLLALAAVAALLAIAYARDTDSDRGLTTEVPIGEPNGLDQACVVNCDNIRTIPVTELGRLVGYLLPDQEDALARAISRAFDLETDLL